MNFENDSATIALAWGELSRSLCKEHGYHRVGGFDLETKTAWACYELGGSMFHIDFLTGERIYAHSFNQVTGFSCGLAEVRNADYSWTHHILTNGQPAYEERFLSVGKFFEDLADVQDETGWYHITPQGKEAYSRRFKQVMFFKYGLCPVFDETGWYHIHPDGAAAYEARNFVRVAPFDESGEALAWCIFELKHNGRKRKVVLAVKINRQGEIISKVRDGFELVKPSLSEITSYNNRAF